MSTKDPKKKPTAKEKLAEQRKMKEDLSGALMAGRLAASTETVTRVKVPTEEELNRPKQKRGSIPPPRRRAPPKDRPSQPPTGAKNERGPVQKKKAPAPKAKKKVKKGTKRLAWDPKRLSQFVAGVITLGELEGISKDEQYEMAELGHQLLRQGKLDDAKKVFDGLVALDPRDAYFHLALGSIAQRNDDLEEAEERYTAALKINPYSVHALANRGEVRMMIGKMLDGAKDLMAALEEDPEAREEATRRARATISVVLRQLEAAGVDVGKSQKKAPPPKKAAGPRKKPGVRAPPGKPQPRRRPRSPGKKR